MFTALSDTEMILIIVGLFYLFECVVWLPEAALAFTSAFGRFRLAVFPLFLRRSNSRAALLSLFPGSRSLVAEDWPIAVSPDGISVNVGPDQGHYITFEALNLVKAEQHKLQINQSTITCAASDCSKYLAELLQELQTATADERSKLIESALKSRFSLTGSSRRLEHVERFTAVTRTVSLLFFFWVFVYGPVLYYTVEPRPGMLFRYFIPLGVLWLLQVIMMAVAQRTLLSLSSTEQFNRIATLCFSPAGVMRAAHTITREAFSDYDPSALAVMTLQPQQLRRFLSRRLRNMQYPLFSDILDASGDFRATCHWFCDVQMQAFETMLSEAGINTEKLLTPPTPDFDAVSWCPRCLSQYTLAAGMCPDCLDITLQIFETSIPDISSP